MNPYMHMHTWGTANFRRTQAQKRLHFWHTFRNRAWKVTKVVAGLLTALLIVASLYVFWIITPGSTYEEPTATVGQEWAP